MAAETPDDMDRAAIAEHAQRTAEQSALRKVRRTLDAIEAARTAERSTLRKVLRVCAILAVLGAAYFGALFFGDSGVPWTPPMQVPGTLPQQH
jgi:transposase